MTDDGPDSEDRTDGPRRAGDGGGPDDRAGDPDRSADAGEIRDRDGDGAWYSPPQLTRREVAKAVAGISGLAATGAVAVSAVTGLSDAGIAEVDERLYVEGTYLVNQDGERLSVSDALPLDGSPRMTVFPQAEDGGPVTEKEATTVLLRFEEGAYQEPTVLDWTVEGYVAYSMVCTHAGCLVSSTDGDDMVCPCHVSVFDPTRGAVVQSGPAPRPLPQLPIGVSEDGDLLIATGPFEGPIGPQ